MALIDDDHIPRIFAEEWRPTPELKQKRMFGELRLLQKHEHWVRKEVQQMDNSYAPEWIKLETDWRFVEVEES
jgi:hypothetical protein